MSAGANILSSAYAKLRWAESRHDEMQRTFAAFALPEDPEQRPYGIAFHARSKPRGLVVATFTIEKSMPAEMSLLAADLVHNTRVALDHTLARLKERFGGNPGHGSFPICATTEDWDERIEKAGRGRNPLTGLGGSAVDFIREVQPMRGDEPENDPLLVLNRLDNDDKHRLLHTSFVYPGEAEQDGVDLIEITQADRVLGATSFWAAGQPLEHGTTLATFMVRNPEAGILRARPDAQIGFAIGEFNAGRTQFTAMIERASHIVDGAAELIDRGNHDV